MRAYSFFILLVCIVLVACAAENYQMQAASGPIEVQSSTNLYYFSDDDRKIASVETEYAEGGEEFRYRRDPSSVALDMAAEERAQGNVCLNQLAVDLKQAERKNHIEDLCQSLFEAEIEKANASYLHDSSLACVANVEAKKSNGLMEIYLSLELKGASATEPDGVKKYSSLVHRSDSKQSYGAVAAEQKIQLGSSMGWKQLLKSGSCSLNEAVLAKIQKRAIRARKEQKKLELCEQGQKNLRGDLAHLQNLFREYVPGEWLKEYKLNFEHKLFQAKELESYSDWKRCFKDNKSDSMQLEQLADISKELAKKHSVPALNYYYWSENRQPSSIPAEVKSISSEQSEER